METINGRYQDIDYVASLHIDESRVCVSARLLQNGSHFLSIEDSASIANCARESLRDLAIVMVEMCIREEIAIAVLGQHAAWRFLNPETPKAVE